MNLNVLAFTKLLPNDPHSICRSRLLTCVQLNDTSRMHEITRLTHESRPACAVVGSDVHAPQVPRHADFPLLHKAFQTLAPLVGTTIHYITLFVLIRTVTYMCICGGDIVPIASRGDHPLWGNLSRSATERRLR